MATFRPATRTTGPCSDSTRVSFLNVFVCSSRSSSSRIASLSVIVQYGLLAPIENDFTGIPGTQHGKSLFVIGVMKTVGDDGRNVQSGFEHDSHLVPGFVHLASIDTFDREHVKNDPVPIDRHVPRRNSQHGDFGAVAHIG